MALVKRTDVVPEVDGSTDRREHGRDVDSLIAALANLDSDSDARRWAALDLAGKPEAVAALGAALAQEGSRAVRDAIVTALVQTGGEPAARALAPHLRSEDAAVRNAAVEALALVPETAILVPDLLVDSDPDVRVLCLMVLASLRDPRVPDWLLEVVANDRDANVCGCAVDVLAEVGDLGNHDALEALPARFPADPFLPFAVRSAIERLSQAAS